MGRGVELGKAPEVTTPSLAEYKKNSDRVPRHRVSILGGCVWSQHLDLMVLVDIDRSAKCHASLAEESDLEGSIEVAKKSIDLSLYRQIRWRCSVSLFQNMFQGRKRYIIID